MSGKLISNARAFFLLCRRIYNGLYNNYAYNMAAELAFFGIFSILPFLVFFMTVLSVFPLFATPEKTMVFLQFGLPHYFVKLIEPSVADIISKQRHWLTFTTLALTLWSASSAVSSLIDSLNRIYNVRETRPYLRLKLISIVLTMVLMLLLFLIVVVFLVSPYLKGWLLLHFGILFTFKNYIWVLACGLILFALEIIYRFGPNRKRSMHFFSAGSLVTLAGFFLVTRGIRFYFDHFSSYNIFYGAMGGLIVIMSWMYLMGLMLLIGGLVNHELIFTKGDYLLAEEDVMGSD